MAIVFMSSICHAARPKGAAPKAQARSAPQERHIAPKATLAATRVGMRTHPPAATARLQSPSRRPQPLTVSGTSMANKVSGMTNSACPMSSDTPTARAAVQTPSRFAGQHQRAEPDLCSRMAAPCPMQQSAPAPGVTPISAASTGRAADQHRNRCRGRQSACQAHQPRPCKSDQKQRDLSGQPLQHHRGGGGAPPPPPPHAAPRARRTAQIGP